MQEFVSGAKELMAYAAEHGGSSLFGWYTFFYVADHFVSLALDVVGFIIVIFILYALFLWIRKEVREQAEQDREYKRKEEVHDEEMKERQARRDRIRYT